MFLYPNKVVGFQIFSDATGSVNPPDCNIYVNGEYVGDVTLDASGDLVTGSRFIGSSDESYSISPTYSFANAVNDPAIYYFNPFLLNEGLNNIEIYVTDAATGSIEIALFNISGSTLIYESGIAFGNFTTTDTFPFTLTVPVPSGLSDLNEFDPVFDVDTGNLNQIFTGSGVHLQRDVTFSFDFLDQQGFTVATDDDYINNPLLDSVIFDVLDATGGMVFPNYLSGKSSRSLFISELDNESIFGSYTKDFGVRIVMPNSFDNSRFTGVFLVYGNLPNISLLTPDYSEFSGAAQSTEGFDVGVSLQNDLRYIRMDRYDVYASTGAALQLPQFTYLDPQNQDGYLFSQSALNVEDVYNLRIEKYNLEKNIPYYFTIVPYGVLGSGRSSQLGPVTFVDSNLNDQFPSVSARELNLVHGEEQSSNVFFTGSVSGSGILHSFDTGLYTTAQYLIEIKCPDGVRRSSKLIGVVNPDVAPPNDLSLFQDVINNTGVSAVSYSLTGSTGNSVNLYVSGVGGLGTYKFQATLI
jgi:hypothetical protein